MSRKTRKVRDDNGVTRNRMEELKDPAIPCAYCGNDVPEATAYQFNANAPYCSEACAGAADER